MVANFSKLLMRTIPSGCYSKKTFSNFDLIRKNWNKLIILCSSYIVRSNQQCIFFDKLILDWRRPLGTIKHSFLSGLNILLETLPYSINKLSIVPLEPTLPVPHLKSKSNCQKNGASDKFFHMIHLKYTFHIGGGDFV